MNYFAQSKGDELIMAATGRLIVILAAEVVGYATLIRADEKGTLEQLEAHRDQFIYPKIAECSGRLVKGNWRLSARRVRKPNRGGAVRRRAATRHGRS